jgi:hypothetical protein
MRKTITDEHKTNQAVKGMRGSQRDCVKNHTISTATDTAQSMPIMVLLYPKESRYSEKKT